MKILIGSIFLILMGFLSVLISFLSILKSMGYFSFGGEGTLPDELSSALIYGGGSLMVLGVLLLAFGSRLTKITHGKTSVELEPAVPKYTEESANIAEQVEQKVLDLEERKQCESYAETKVLPGGSVPDYSAVQSTQVSQLLVRPSAHPMTPMYILDKNYRILDWNEAFSLAFDRTMEGRQGQSVLEWMYHLDNYEEVLDHGESIFSGVEKLPYIDVENIEYTSLRYGPFSAVKRAFQVPDDNGQCFGWLITMDLQFTNPNEKLRYKYDLLRLNGLEQLWSEYAISYDRVLTNTRVYRDLLDTLLGIKGEQLKPIDLNAKVIDLGAGTGNVSMRLMKGNSKRTVFAVDKNRIMLDFLRDKCHKFLIEDDQSPGILAIKQDISSLFGFPENYFDCVIANNVFYTLADPEACLESIFRVLKPGGELRISDPRADTNLDILFERIKLDLQNEGKYSEFQSSYEHVEQINKFRLNTMIHKWSTQEFCTLLEDNRFIVTHSSEEVYAGQSMIVSAQKPFTDESVTKFNVQRS